MRLSGLVLVVLFFSLTHEAPAQGKKGKPPETIIAGKAVGEWVKALSDKELLPRIQAVNALMQAGPEARTAAPALIALFRDDKASFLHPLAVVALSRIGSDAVPALRKALADPLPTVKIKAALSLGVIGEGAKDAVPELAAALKDKDTDLRQGAAQALGRIGSGARAATSRLNELLTDPDAQVRLEVALALWRAAADVRGVKVLAALVVDKEESLALRAIEGIAEVGPQAKAAIPALKKVLSHMQPAIRLAAAEALSRLGDDAGLTVALAEVASRKGEERRQAIAGMGSLVRDEKAIEQLARLLTDAEADADLRREAACALCERGVRRSAARKALEAGLDDLDPGVRWWSAVALAGAEFDIRKREEDVSRVLQFALFKVPEPPAKGVLDVLAVRRAAPALAEIMKARKGPLAVAAAASLAGLGLELRPVAEELYAALREAEAGLRDKAAAALATVGTEAMPRLIQLLSSRDDFLRAGAAQTLGFMGLPARGQVAKLTQLLRDPEPGVRTAAALALWRVDRNADVALPAFNLILKDVDNKERWQAIEGIGTVAVEASPPIRGLTEILLGGVKDRDIHVRMHSAKWLWRRTKQPRVAIPLIQEGATDRDLAARLTAIETLGEMAMEERALTLLVTALDDKSSQVRLAVVEGLAKSLPVKTLIDQTSTKNPKLRLALVRAIGLVGPEAKEALQPLLKLHAESDAITRLAITQSVANLFPDRPREVQAVASLLRKLQTSDSEMRQTLIDELKKVEKQLLSAKP